MARRKAESAPVTVTNETVGEQNADTVTNNDQQEAKPEGTTAALFGQQTDFKPEPTKVAEQPAVSEEKKDVDTTPEPQPEELYLEDLLEKQGIPLDKVKSRIKVDGKEEVISFDEFRKRVQLKEHIDRAGQELGRQRREILELRKGQEKERTPISPVPVQPDPSQQRSSQEIDPYFAALERRLAEIEARTVPIIHDTNRQQFIKELKAEGFEDAADLLPRIELEIAKEKDVEMQNYYDTIPGAKALAYRLKSQDLMEQLKKKDEAPKSASYERPKPPIQKIDGGSQTSTLNVTDDWNGKYNELLNKWKKTKDRSVFQELLKHQNALTF